MIENENPRIRSLLRQAIRNKESGKLAAAEVMYKQILEEAPDTLDAWLGLADVTKNVSEKESAFERVLEIDGQNAQAIKGLAQIREEDPVIPEDKNPPIENELTEREDILEGGDSILAPKQVEYGSWDMPDQPAFSSNPSPILVKQSRELEHLHDHDIDGEVNQTIDYLAGEDLVCYRHPNRSTSLRCYKCNKPICSQCTVKTPVGYLCPDCHREAEDAFFNARPIDYLIVALVALPISLLAGWLVVRFSGGFFIIIIMLFAGGFVGGVIGRLAKRVIGHRRGRYIPHLVAACVIIGVVIPAIPVLLLFFFGNLGGLFSLIGPGVYLATATGSAYFWAR